MLKEYKEKR